MLGKFGLSDTSYGPVVPWHTALSNPNPQAVKKYYFPQIILYKKLFKFTHKRQFILQFHVAQCLFVNRRWTWSTLIPAVVAVTERVLALIHAWTERSEGSVCVFSLSWHSLLLFLLNLSPPGLAGLWHPDRGSAWKQTAAAAPVTDPDRCAARCRVARRLEYRCMADRYHNHTSPLLSLTYWIKHLPSCSWIAHPSFPKPGGKETSWSVFWVK